MASPSHGHDLGGGEHSHLHSVSVETDSGMLALALTINVAFTAVVTFGLKRGEVPSAQINGITMLILAAFIVFEGIRRLVSPPEVEAGLVFWVGITGLASNLGAAWVLAKANRESLNVEGAFQHNLIDALGSVGAAAAAVVILATGLERADPIASLVVAALMLLSAYRLLKASGRIFFEAAPEGMDPDAIGEAMLAQPGVVEVHDLRLWEITSGFPTLSAHVIAEELKSSFQIDHSTRQVEHQPLRLLKVEEPD